MTVPAGTPVPVTLSPAEINPVTALAVICLPDPVPVKVASGQFAGVSVVAADIEETAQKPSGVWPTLLCAKAGAANHSVAAAIAAARLSLLRIVAVLLLFAGRHDLPRLVVAHRSADVLVGHDPR